MTIHETDDHFENKDASVQVSKVSGDLFFEKAESLKVQVVLSGGKRNREAFVGIYGKPEGLRQLADLLNAVANVDQTKIPDRKCPRNEGMHTTLEAGLDFPGSKISVNVGRLDCKGDGTTSWFRCGDDVRWIEAADYSVWIWYHDGADVERLADSFEQWLEMATLSEDEDDEDEDD